MPTLTRRTILFLFGVLALLLSLAYLVYVVYLSPTGYRAQERAALTAVDTSETAHYEALDGAPVRIEDFRGSVLVVNVWASWSPYTKDDHQVLASVIHEFKEQVRFVALNRMEHRDVAQAYLDSIGTTEGLTYILDTTDTFFTTLDGYAMPETLVFDRVGNVVLHRRGLIDREELTETLSALLKTEGVAQTP